MSELIKMGIAKTGITQPKGILSVDTAVKTPPPFETIVIGTQEWSEFDIKVDDGGSGIYYPNGDINNVEDYGLLYNHEAAVRITSSIAMDSLGWRFPTNSDFDILAIELGGVNVAGGKMKSIGYDYWDGPNIGATNEIGFNSRGAGRSISGISGSFRLANYFWTSTPISGGYVRRYTSYSGEFLGDGGLPSSQALSLRMLKDI